MRVHRKLVPKSRCAFCFGLETWHSRIKGSETKNVYAVPNKFPAFSGTAPTLPQRKGIFSKIAGSGVHELIVTKSHSLKIANASQEFWTEFLSVSKNRIIASYKNPRVAYSMLIYNHGAEAGASIQHPHAQLFAPPRIPNFVKMELRGSQNYFGRHKRCVFCEMIQAEIAQGIRMVYENEMFAAFCFYASRFPFETWILPKNHNGDFTEINKKEMAFFADCVSCVLRKMYKHLNNPPWNFYIHNLPLRLKEPRKHYHWHMEITPRLTKFGGFELGGDMVINVMAPEAAAEFLRKA
jgi:UDPglucose--hexose-1-phosphate uridylyltransferase